MKETKHALTKAVATFPDGQIATMEVRTDFPLQGAPVVYAGVHRRLSWHPENASASDIVLKIRMIGDMKSDGATWAIVQAGEFLNFRDGGMK